MASKFPRGLITPIRFQSAGLTTSVTNYASGDVLGSETTVLVADEGGAMLRVHSARVTDAADVIGALDLFVFTAASTPAADNAANSWADADVRNLAGIISLTTVYDTALNKIVQTADTWLPRVFVTTGSSLYVVAVTRTANNFFGAVTDLEYTLMVEALR